MNVGKVGRDVLQCRAATVAKVQTPIQLRIIERAQRRPVNNSSDLRRLDVLGDDSLRDLQRERDTLERQGAFIPEPQQLLDPVHGNPFRRHPAPRENTGG